MSTLLEKIGHQFYFLNNKINKVKASFQPKNVYCFCCNKGSNTFLPFGHMQRKNALCSVCGSLERHRLHWHYMVNKTNLVKNVEPLKLLHIAPEKVLYDKFYDNNKFDYVPCAKFGEGYTDTYPKGTIDVDITEMAFEDNSFDVIYCSHVLEHVPDDIKAIKEFLRVLKPTGWAMLQVPIDPTREETYEDFSIVDAKERENAFGQYDHVRIYGKDYIQRLVLAGFTVKVEAYHKEFTQAEIAKYGFMENEDIHICTKG